MENVIYPTRMEVQLPDRYDRWQVALRLLILCALGTLQQQVGGTFGLLYLVLPGVAAVLITQRTGRGFLERDAGWLTVTLEWVLGLYAYLMFVTDRVPLDRATRPLQLSITPRAEPTLSDALLRMLTSLPHALVLGLLSIVSCIASMVMAVVVLVRADVPASLRDFQLGLLGWTARALAYHSSLVDEYPPFQLGLSAGQPPQAGPTSSSSIA